MSSSALYTPQVSIIIRTRDEERFIDQTLRAIFAQEVDLKFEVIVVDSGSTDGTIGIVRQFETRLYQIDPEEFTYGRALNYGASFASGEYLINLSAHCIPVDRRWMRKLLDPLRTTTHVVATYGGQVPIKGLNPFEEVLLRAAFTSSQGKILSPFSNSNCAIRKRIWELYPFDEQASFAEDYIWSQLLPAEYTIQYVPDAAVYHTHPLEIKYWKKRSYQNGVFVQYLQHVYGLQYPWIRRGSNLSPVSWKTLLRMAKSYAGECAGIIKFLLINRYFRFLPLLPIYVVLQRYYYYRGLAEGRKLYGSPER